MSISLVENIWGVSGYSFILSFYETLESISNVKQTNKIRTACVKKCDKLSQSCSIHFERPSFKEEHLIRWVITVPAIWKERSKHFMRLAAYEVWYWLNQISPLWCNISLRFNGFDALCFKNQTKPTCIRSHRGNIEQDCTLT